MRSRVMLLIAVGGLFLASCGDGESTRITQLDVTTTGMAVTSTVPPASSDEGPVAADEAQIEMTYSEDGTSYTGDREIVEGTVTITFTNETNSLATWSVWGYETGSEALAEELAFLEEGKKGVPPAPLPVAGFYSIEYEWPDDIGEPGTQTWIVELAPGTWIFDVGPEDFRTTGLWRAAVIDVVAE